MRSYVPMFSIKQFISRFLQQQTCVEAAPLLAIIFKMNFGGITLSLRADYACPEFFSMWSSMNWRTLSMVTASFLTMSLLVDLHVQIMRSFVYSCSVRPMMSVAGMNTFRPYFYAISVTCRSVIFPAGIPSCLGLSTLFVILSAYYKSVVILYELKL